MNAPDILRIVKEDVLRILGEEEGNSVSLASLPSEIRVSRSFLLEAVEELEKEGSVYAEEKFVVLTKKGQEAARGMVRKHVFIENYFRETKSREEAHKAAHILEHCVSQGVIDNIKKLSTLREEGIPVTRFNLNEEGIITGIAFSDLPLFERIISMGIFPGEKIRVTNVIPGSVIVSIGNKKFALGEEIAKGIESIKK